jgi:acyl-CoA thioesterase-1
LLTRSLLFHIASGQAFFSGAAFLLLAIGLAFLSKKRWLTAARNILIGLGGSLIAISGTPLPGAQYAFLVVVLIVWLVGESQSSRLRLWLVHTLRAAAIITCLSTVLAELPYHVMPRVPPLGHPILGVIGDSVTAGMGEPRVTNWPGVLAQKHGIEIRDHSRMGATVASARKQAAEIDQNERLILLEIGGNDLLGGTTPDDFEAELESLLTAVCRPGRVVVMLELPLPPGYNRFGLIQRSLSGKHRALLVPKRLLLGILQQAGTTLDTIHLSQEGHSRMADAVWSVLSEGFQD